jgi:hypothetical protein
MEEFSKPGVRFQGLSPKAVMLFETVGLFIVAGLDELFETRLVDVSPAWLIDRTTLSFS